MFNSMYQAYMQILKQQHE